MKSPVVKRSIVVAGHKTSVSLEEAFWNGMKEIASARSLTLSELVGEIDGGRQQGNLSSAIRLFVLDYFRSRAIHSTGNGSSRLQPESSHPSFPASNTYDRDSVVGLHTNIAGNWFQLLCTRASKLIPFRNRRRGSRTVSQPRSVF